MRTGAGDDKLILEGVNVNGPLDINTGGGDDIVGLLSVAFAGPLQSINTSQGNDVVYGAGVASIGGAAASPLMISTGIGDDSVDLGGILSVNFEVSTSAGDDNVLLDFFGTVGLDANGGPGEDALTFTTQSPEFLEETIISFESEDADAAPDDAVDCIFALLEIHGGGEVIIL